jgi:hypothetical protein
MDELNCPYELMGKNGMAWQALMRLRRLKRINGLLKAKGNRLYHGEFQSKYSSVLSYRQFVS